MSQNHRSTITMLIVLLSSMLFLTGCATSERVRLLEVKVTALEGSVKSSTQDLYMTSSNELKKNTLFREQMTQRLSHFKNKYSPAMRAELEANLIASNVHKDHIATLRRVSTRDRKSIAGQLSDSGQLLAVIKENERTSTVKNVTNEFRRLRKKWGAVSQKLEESVEISSRTSELSFQHATSAQNSALIAQNNSTAAVVAAERASYQYQNLARKVHRAELDIQTIYAAIDKAEHFGADDHNKLTELSKELRRIKSKLKTQLHSH